MQHGRAGGAAEGLGDAQVPIDFTFSVSWEGSDDLEDLSLEETRALLTDDFTDEEWLAPALDALVKVPRRWRWRGWFWWLPEKLPRRKCTSGSSVERQPPPRRTECSWLGPRTSRPAPSPSAPPLAPMPRRNRLAAPGRL